MYDKDSYLKQVKSELKTAHPDVIPSNLLCFFSQNVIKNPVITPNGRVYSEHEIKRWLKDHDADPFRTPLKVGDLRPFPELETSIRDFTALRISYSQTKIKLLVNASKVDPDSDAVPDIFKCSISGELMNKAYLTRKGKLVDGSQLDAIGPTQAVEFTEFNEHLSYYLDNRKPVVDRVASTSNHSILSSFLSSW